MNEMTKQNGEGSGESEKLRRNERIKLAATWFNGMSIAAIAVGGFSQITAASGSPTGIAGALLTSAAWGGVALALHLVAQAVLGRLGE